MLKQAKKNNEGFILLISVLLMGALATTVTISVLLLGLGSIRNGSDVHKIYQAKALAELCAEEALEKIRQDKTYVETREIEMGFGDCTYEIVDLEGGGRQIDGSGEVDGVFRKVRVIASSAQSNIVIDSWIERVGE